jgi:hypothetical protein
MPAEPIETIEEGKTPLDVLNPEPASPGDSEKPKETPKEPEGLASLREENLKLRQMAEKAIRDGEEAKSYVHQLMGQLQGAASAARSVAAEPGVPLNDEMREQLQQDPIGVLDAHFQARMAPMREAYLKNQDALNRQLAAERLSKQGWKDYEKEVDAFMAPVPYEVRAQPGAYESAFRIVLANHLDEEVEKRVAAKQRPRDESFVEPASGGPGRAKPAPILSEVEKSVAREFGMSEEEYAKWKNL